MTVAEVLRLIDGEVAFYAAPGAPIPELTLLVRPDDPVQARESAERLLRAIAAMEVGEVTEDGDVTTAVFDDFTVNLGMVDDTLVLTTTKDAIADLGSAPARSWQTPTATRTRRDSRRPGPCRPRLDRPQGDDHVIMGFAWLSGSLPPEVSRNLEPLRSLVAYSERTAAISSSRSPS